MTVETRDQFVDRCFRELGVRIDTVEHKCTSLQGRVNHLEQEVQYLRSLVVPLDSPRRPLGACEPNRTVRPTEGSPRYERPEDVPV